MKCVIAPTYLNDTKTKPIQAFASGGGRHEREEKGIGSVVGRLNRVE
jgi:hypothetical protein